MMASSFVGFLRKMEYIYFAFLVFGWYTGSIRID